MNQFQSIVQSAKRIAVIRGFIRTALVSIATVGLTGCSSLNGTLLPPSAELLEPATHETPIGLVDLPETVDLPESTVQTQAIHGNQHPLVCCETVKSSENSGRIVTTAPNQSRRPTRLPKVDDEGGQVDAESRSRFVPMTIEVAKR